MARTLGPVSLKRKGKGGNGVQPGSRELGCMLAVSSGLTLWIPEFSSTTGGFESMSVAVITQSSFKWPENIPPR